MTRLSVLLAGAVILCVHLFLGATFSHPLNDDAYISFRYARNLARGEGLVYNPGERVEGFSNPLWVLLLSGVQVVGLDVEAVAHVLGLFFSLAILLTVLGLFPEDPGSGIPRFGAAILAGTSVYSAYWSGKGLETSLYGFLLTLGALDLVHHLRRGTPGWRWAVPFGIAGVCRPEGILWGMVSVTAFALRKGRDPGRMQATAISAAAILLPFIGWLIFRRIYYGTYLPNTVHVKMAANLPFYARGLRYLGYGLLANPLVALGILLVPFTGFFRRPGSKYLWSFASLGILFPVFAGGDHFYGWRLWVPFFPVVYVLLFGGGRSVITLRFGGLRPAVGILCLILLGSLRGIASLWHPSTNGNLVLSRSDMKDRRLIGQWIRRNSEPGDWIATPAAGLIPFEADRPTIDCLGLADLHIARADVLLGKAVAGHEKGDGTYVLSRAPRFLLPHHRLLSRPVGIEWFLAAAYDRSTQEYLRAREFERDYRLRVEWCATGYLHLFERRRDQEPLMREGLTP